jgi:hypothetical protein
VHLNRQIYRLKSGKSFLTIQTLSPTADRVLLYGIPRIGHFRVKVITKRTVHDNLAFNSLLMERVHVPVLKGSRFFLKQNRQSGQKHIKNLTQKSSFKNFS